MLLIVGGAIWALLPTRDEVGTPEQADVQAASSEPDSAPVEEAVEEDVELAPIQNTARVGELVDPPTRNVTPLGVTQGPTVTEPLRRVAGPFRLKPKPRPEPKAERFFKPVIVSAAQIDTKSGSISLLNVEAPPIDEECGDGAQAWPCGTMARSALQRFIRGRAIECHVPAIFEGYPAQLSCSVGGQDIGGWLIEHGWAKPVGSAYSEAARKAQNDERGLWSKTRPSYW